MVETHPLILSLRSAGLKELDPCNVDEVHTMWHAFSKAKNCIDGGDRLEYLSWRIYSREVIRRNATALSGKPGPETQAKIETSTTQSLRKELELESETTDEGEWYSDSDDSDDNEAPNGSDLEHADSKLKSDSTTRLSTPFLNQTPNIHRRLSSLELEKLFNDFQKNTSNNKVRKTEPSLPTPTEPSSSSKSALKSSLVKRPILHQKEINPLESAQNSVASSDSNSTPQHRVTRIRFHEDSLSPTTDIATEASSVVVRGFSPSSISVKKFHSPKEPSPAILSPDNSCNNKVPSPKSSRIFFFGADSDSESNSSGSLVTPASNNSQIAPLLSTENSEWDDTDDEEAEAEENEARKKDMFTEREVPSKPLLKRSLLSSLFISGTKDNSSTPDSGTPSDGTLDDLGDKTISISRQNENQQNLEKTHLNASHAVVPVDILLGAQLTHHFPFVGSKAQASIPSSSKGTEIHQPKPLSVMVPHRRPFNSRSTSANDAALLRDGSSDLLEPGKNKATSSTHMTARPEIYRASTDPKISRGNSTDESFNSHWAHQHEDIYDPMNYHSRGW